MTTTVAPDSNEPKPTVALHASDEPATIAAQVPTPTLPSSASNSGLDAVLPAVIGSATSHAPAITNVSMTVKRNLGAIALVAVIAMPVACWWAMERRMHVHGWLIVLGALVLFAALLGRSTVGMWRGTLIDQRNVMSLSRFQLILWTVIVLSAYLAAALYNVFTGVDEPLGIAIPTQLWLLMGVSTASMVGAPLVLSEKVKKVPVDANVEQAKADVQASGGERSDVRPAGQLLTNARPDLAVWSDMFTGDEASNWVHVDLAKLQMFFFTLAIAASYASSLWRMFSFAQPDGLLQFPVLDQSTVALLGISHAGYLANKAVPRQ